MARHGTDFIWLYRQRPLSFDYTPYAPVIRQIAGLTNLGKP